MAAINRHWASRIILTIDVGLSDPHSLNATRFDRRRRMDASGSDDVLAHASSDLSRKDRTAQTSRVSVIAERLSRRTTLKPNPLAALC
ncbi:MAG: hypothetical protein E5W70_18615 [Mesorhizobium sp.]|uniref:hypothetical protein n=1 Tax=Mesorhizobium sp. TaxID=1871066 RepID=UPI00121A4A5B|nr:hypothetical protein [Mesorhizobium sp.]TIT21051.1 MAG: hypothetical protein E5W70_18615 [Mesorhizobium sp.]